MRKRLFAWVAFLTVIGKSAGALIPFCIAIVYGAGIETDAFFLAFGLIFFLFRIFSHIFESVIIPYFSEQKKHADSIIQFANAALFALIPVVLIICFIIDENLETWVMAFNGWSPESSELVASLFYEMVPFLILSIWISQASGLLYSAKRFGFAAASPLLRSAVVLAAIFWGKKYFGIHALSLGFLFGEALRWIVTLIQIKIRLRWSAQVDWIKQGPRVQKFYGEMIYQFFALAAVNAIYFVDLWFASRLPEGSVSILNYADRLLQIAYILFQNGFLNIYHSFWSDQYYQESPVSFWKYAKRDIRLVSIVSCIISALLFMNREFCVRSAFSLGGKFSDADFEIMTRLFGWFAIGFTPVILYLLYVRVIFVMKKNSFYCVLSYVLLSLKVISNMLFIRWWGLEGIAISLVFSYSIIALWLWGYLILHWKDKVPAKPHPSL